MHPRLCLHQVAFMAEPMPDFIAFAREIGMPHVTLANPHAVGPEVLGRTLEALAPGGVKVATVVQPFARYPDLEKDGGEAAEKLNEAIDAAAMLAADHLYIITGGRGGLDWEAAAARCAELLAPCIAHGKAKGVQLSVETSNLLNADIHIAHTLDDTIKLAEIAGIGVTLDIGAIWVESDLATKFKRAMPITRLVQLSDYVLGDRSTPFKAVPGDGVIPNERLIGMVLDLGYEGPFDLELVSPRIDAEGPRSAAKRAADYVSEMLVRLGA